MAKCILTIEDDFRDGNPIIRGKFDVVDGPVSHDGSLVKFTPAQLYMTTVQRLWDAGSINTFVRMACPDMLYKNDMIERQKQAPVAEPPATPANDASPIDRAGAEEAEVLQNAEQPVVPKIVEAAGRLKATSSLKKSLAFAGSDVGDGEKKDAE